MLLEGTIESKKVEQYLNEVSFTPDDDYVPSDFALDMVNFIKLVTDGSGEEHLTPILHLYMLDTVANDPRDIINMVFRGSAKALAVDTITPTPLGPRLFGDLQVGDEVFSRTGEPTKITHKSEIFMKQMYKIVLEDGRELKVSEDHLNIVLRRNGRKGFNEYVMSTEELLKGGPVYPREKGYRNPRGFETKYWIPTPEAVEYTEKELPIDPYTLGVILGDGSVNKDTGFVRIHCHREDIEELKSYIPYHLGESLEDKRNADNMRFSILKLGPLIKEYVGTENCYDKSIPSQYLISSAAQRLELLRGLMDTDGTVARHKSSKFVTGSFSSVSLQLTNGIESLVRSLGGEASTKKNIWSGRVSYRTTIRLNTNPFKLKRKAELWRDCLIGRTGICAIEPIELQPSQCIAVACDTKSFLGNDYIVTHNTTLLAEFLIFYIAVYGEIPHLKDINLVLYVTDTIDNGVKNMAKNLEHRYDNSNFLQKYLKVNLIQNRWEFTTLSGRKLVVKGYGAQTGIRGVKELNVRPQLAIIDDVIGDADAESLPSMSKIKDTIDKAIEHALHPTRRRVIWSGTPFHTTDPLYSAAESGAYAVNVFPVCVRFPCSREEFEGAWPDRFTYDAVMRSYESAKMKGALAGFYQELMLRIRSDEDRLVPDENIKYFKRKFVLENTSAFNFYITTDFATSAKQSADFAVIMVWALTNDGQWFLVDGVCKRQRMPDTINDLFRLVSKWKPQSVGLEISGQQGAFVDWIEEQMLTRNVYFHMASSTSGVAGIRPTGDKFSRFGLTLPLFNLGKIRFAEELKGTPLLDETLLELEFLTKGGSKSAHDDCLDAIAMIMQLDAWRPSEEVHYEESSQITGERDVYAEMWGTQSSTDYSAGISRYIV